MNIHQIIKHAVEKNKAEVCFEVQIDGTTVEFILDELDAYDIQEAQELKLQAALKQAEVEGLFGAPVTDDEWEDFLAKQSSDDLRKTYLKQGKPVDRAHFFALKTIGIRTLIDIVTRSLRDSNRDRVFSNEQDRIEFMRYISTNPALLNRLAENYVKLTEKVKELREAAKNLSAPVSGESATDSPESIPVTGAHSVKS